MIDDVTDPVAFHLLPADGAVGTAGPGVEQPQKVVDLRQRTYGTAGVGRRRLLLDGDGRANTTDVVHLRLLHPHQELPGVTRQALDVAALPLGKKRVHGDARLAAAADAGDDHQLVLGDLEVDVLEVVGPRALDVDGGAEVGSGQGHASALFSRSKAAAGAGVHGRGQN